EEHRRELRLVAELGEENRGEHRKEELQGHGKGASVRAENEVYGTEHAQPGPQVIELDRLLEIQDGERDEHAERDDLLQDLELPDRKDLVADSIGGHLQQILEERYAPAHDGGDEPRPAAELFQMRVPGERHEDIAERQQQYGQRNVTHRSISTVERTMSAIGRWSCGTRSVRRLQRLRITMTPLGGSRSCLSFCIERSAAARIGASAVPSSGNEATPTETFTRTIVASTSSVVENTTLRIRCATSSATVRSASVSNTTNSSPP